MHASYLIFFFRNKNLPLLLLNQEISRDNHLKKYLNNLIKALPKLFRNRNFVLLLISFSLYFGLFNAISITLSFLLYPWYGNNSMAVALVGGSPIISGIIGVMVIGPMQRKSKKYKKWILICMIGNI